MSKVISLKEYKEKREQYEVIFFTWNKESYALTQDKINQLISYGRAFMEEDEMVIEDLDKEESDLVHETVHEFFHIQIASIGGEKTDLDCTLFVYFEFENENYAIYTVDNQFESPFHVFKIEDKRPVEIRDELKLKRIDRWVSENYQLIY